MKEMLKRLQLEIDSPYFTEAYKKAINTPGIPDWLKAEYITHLHNKIGVINLYLDEVLTALDKLVANKDLLLFAKTVYYMLKSDDDSDDVFKGFKLPDARPNEQNSAYDFVGLFPLLAFVEEACDDLIRRGVSEDMVKSTYNFDDCIRLSEIRTGRPSFILRYFIWSLLHAEKRILNIDRLTFEMLPARGCGIVAFKSTSGELKVLMHNVRLCKSDNGKAKVTDDTNPLSFDADFHETEEYYEGYPVDSDAVLVETEKIRLLKSEWKPVLMPDDMVISVHIPAKGSFDKETCKRSYDSARKIFKKCFPEYDFSAFVCFSWLLSPQLKYILKPSSNILGFAEKFTLFPYDAKGYDVFSFVIQKEISDISEIDLDSFPTETSLMRNIKEWYRDGKFIYEAGGFFEF